MSSTQQPMPVLDKSDGAPGSAAPVVATQIGGTDGTNLRAIKTDTSGSLSTIHTDISPANGSVTTLDTATVALVGANGQVFYFGTPTTNSSANFTLSSVDQVVIESSIIGTGGTLVVETSMDGGTSWTRPSVYQPGTQSYTNAFTLPFVGVLNVAGMTNLRIRSTGSWSGSATIIVKQSLNPNSVTIGNSLPAGSNVIGAVSQSGTFQVVGNTADGAPDVGNPIKIAGTDGTNVQTIKTDVGGILLINSRSGLSPSSPTAVSIGVATTLLVSANASRRGLVLVNISANKVSLAFGTSAVLNTGITLMPFGSFVMDEYTYTTVAVNAIASVASSVVTVQEYT